MHRFFARTCLQYIRMDVFEHVWVYVFPQERQRQWTHPEADQSIGDGNAGHSV